MVDRHSIEKEARKALEFFLRRGAVHFDTDILQPAASILDLYGEDIRSRAFVTEDAAHGELILRPDFTVPLVKSHMESAKKTERYAYSGRVFRRQWSGSLRPDEYIQVGYEIFGHQDQAAADTEIFCAFHELLSAVGLRSATGDLNILISAVNSLTATDRQKNTLKRHLWRPAKFRRLLELYRQGGASLAMSRHPKSIRSSIEREGAVIGQRTVEEVIDNVQAKIEDAKAPELDGKELAAIDEIMTIKGSMTASLKELRRMSQNLPGLKPSVDQLETRMNAMLSHGIDVDKLRFETSFGRTRLEYYDGFVFGFLEPNNPQSAALGGRYDFLTEALGGGRKCPAVGGMMRPALIAAMKAKMK